MREEIFGNARLILGDCLSVIPTIDRVTHCLTDPPYHAVMQDSFGRVSIARQGLGDIRKLQSVSRRGELEFQSIDLILDQFVELTVPIVDKWFIAFCIAEGVQHWRDALQAAGARYKRAMVWTKPDAMPQFNGQGPAMGHEMMVSAWCGKGHSSWNGGGRVGNFSHTKERDRVHDTQKPLPLMRELVGLFTDPGDIILDPFMGAGTTGISCLEMDRQFIGIEKDEAVFDIACKRFEGFMRQPSLFQAQKPKQEELL